MHDNSTAVNPGYINYAGCTLTATGSHRLTRWSLHLRQASTYGLHKYTVSTHTTSAHPWQTDVTCVQVLTGPLHMKKRQMTSSRIQPSALSKHTEVLDETFQGGRRNIHLRKPQSNFSGFRNKYA